MSAAVRIVATRWQYLLVGDTEDPERALSGALASDGTASLVRCPPGDTGADSARRDGSWGQTDVLARIHFRGEILWTAEISADDARRVVRAWRAAGRFQAEPPIEEHLPTELAADIERNARTTDRAERLRTGPPLDPQDVERVRTQLLSDGELAPAWLAAPGRVARRARPALPLLYPQDVERVRNAFASVGADTLWAVCTADPADAELWRLPVGVALSNDDDWLAGLGRVHAALHQLVLTTPDLRAVILDVGGPGTVAGPAGFVDLLIGS